MQTAEGRPITFANWSIHFQNKNRYFTPQICQKLVELVQNYAATSSEVPDLSNPIPPNVDWEHVADELNILSRSPKLFTPIDCYLRYVNKEDPSINKTEWTREEDRMLLELAIETKGYNWDWIASKLGTNRTPFQCLQHYRQTLVPVSKAGNNITVSIRDEDELPSASSSSATSSSGLLINSSHWTPEEDELLTQSLDIYGLHNWSHVANSVGNNRTALQCHKRALLLREQSETIATWTSDDDQLLLQAAIAMRAPMRWKSDVVESTAPITAIATASDTDIPTEIKTTRNKFQWKLLADRVPGKSAYQCRYRWLNVIDPGLNHSPFTKEEDDKLKLLAARIGVGKWSQIAKFFPDRTNHMIHSRWKVIAPVNEKTRLAEYRKRKLLQTPIYQRKAAAVSNKLTPDDFESVLTATINPANVLDRQQPESVPADESNIDENESSLI